jgi:hypothetical protein
MVGGGGGEGYVNVKIVSSSVPDLHLYVFGLLDPHRDLQFICTDPDPDPSINKQNKENP